MVAIKNSKRCTSMKSGSPSERSTDIFTRISVQTMMSKTCSWTAWTSRSIQSLSGTSLPGSPSTSTWRVGLQVSFYSRDRSERRSATSDVSLVCLSRRGCATTKTKFWTAFRWTRPRSSGSSQSFTIRTSMSSLISWVASVTKICPSSASSTCSSSSLDSTIWRLQCFSCLRLGSTLAPKFHTTCFTAGSCSVLMSSYFSSGECWWRMFLFISATRNYSSRDTWWPGTK